MTCKRQAFIAAIREAPDDDAPRLIFADWLDEHGEPERAEFIRVQCELASLGPEPFDDMGSGVYSGDKHSYRRDNLSARCRLLYERSDKDGLCNAIAWGLRYPLLPAPLNWFKRGFLELVELPANDWLTHDWLTHDDAILDEHPIREVTLTTPLELEYFQQKQNMEKEGAPVISQWQFVGSPRIWQTDRLHSITKNPSLMPTLEQIAGICWPGIKFSSQPAG